MVILMQNCNDFRKLGFDDYLEVRKIHNASEREVMREKPYFDKVLEHCSSEKNADKFCEEGKNQLIIAQYALKTASVYGAVFLCLH